MFAITGNPDSLSTFMIIEKINISNDMNTINPTILAKMFQRKIKKFIILFFSGLTY